jgi:hypothetical protein
MSIPSSAVAFTSTGTFLSPDDRVRASYLVDYEMGGTAVGDAGAGSTVQIWEGSYSDPSIRIRVEGTSTWQTILSVAGVTEFSFAFNQAMWPVVVYKTSAGVYLWWRDATTQQTLALGATVSGPMVTLDDKRAGSVATSDVLVAYILGGNLCYRQSRDAYAIEYTLLSAPPGASRVVRLGMSTDLRLLIELDQNAGTVSAVVTDLLTDSMYLACGVQVAPMFAAAPLVATWRSRRFVVDMHPMFAWLRLEGPVTSAVVRLYGDGALYYTTPAITNNDPIRLPARRFREFEIEIESAGRVTQVVLAHGSDELRQV